MGSVSVRQSAVTETQGVQEPLKDMEGVMTLDRIIVLMTILAPLALSMPQPQGGGSVREVTYVGELGDTDHDVGGKVYILDQDTLVIDNFSYDNEGFGVFINVATKGNNLKSWERNRIDVPYPSGTQGEPIEKKYTGNGQLLIDLSQVGVKADQVKWLSVWCTVFQQSFGHVVF